MSIGRKEDIWGWVIEKACSEDWRNKGPQLSPSPYPFPPLPALPSYPHLQSQRQAQGGQKEQEVKVLSSLEPSACVVSGAKGARALSEGRLGR